MAGIAITANFDTKQDGVLIAIGKHINNMLNLARCVAFAPDLLARARPVMRHAGFKTKAQRLIIHVSDHQHILTTIVDSYTNHEAIRAETWREA